MRNTNRLLIRLNKAVDCSNSKYLSERALAVILFDNLIETHLYHLLTYNMFINKNSNGLDLYRYSHSQIKNYEDILKYAKKENLINTFEQKILKFAHKQRNKIYHENQFIQNDIELSIILYYIFISKKRDEWEKAASFKIYSNNIDDEQINFGQGLIEEAFPFDHKKYYYKTWDYIVQKWKIRRNFAKTCKRNILNQIKRIQHSSKYLKKTLKEYNYLYDTEYYSFVKEKDKEDCRNIDFILLVHMYYRLISEDTNAERNC